MNVFVEVHPVRWIVLFVIVTVVVLSIGWALKTLFAHARRTNRFTFWLWLVVYLLVIFPIPATVVGYSFERLIGSVAGDTSAVLRGMWFATTMLWMVPMLLFAVRYSRRYPPPDQHQRRVREV